MDKPNYSIFKCDESGNCKIAELAQSGKFNELRELFIDNGLSKIFDIHSQTTDEMTLRNIIIKMFAHIPELEASGITRRDIANVKYDVYSALDNKWIIDDEVLLAGKEYLTSIEV